MAAYVQDAIVLLGDSITQAGWEPLGLAQQLSSVYGRRLDVINRGLGGYNTDWIIPVFEQCLAKQPKSDTASPKVRILTIWFGANDACLPGSRQHVPLHRFAANLTHLVGMVHNPASAFFSPETRILLITPPPINPPQRLDDLVRVPEVVARYAQAVRDVGAKENIPVVDVHNAFLEAVDNKVEALSKYLSDGLHLSGEGYQLAFDALMRTITDKLPDLHPDKIQQVFPPWDEVDLDDIPGSTKKRTN